MNQTCCSRPIMLANQYTLQQEQFQYRATHDVRRRVTDDQKMNIMTRRIPPDVTFGISTRPSTPVFDLLENKYQEKWLLKRREAELARRERTVQQVCSHPIYPCY